MQNAAWQDTATQELLEKAENASNSPLTPDALNEQLRREQKRAQRGKMSSLYSQQSLSQRELDKNYSTTPANQRFYSYVWNDSYGDLLALTAIGKR